MPYLEQALATSLINVCPCVCSPGPVFMLHGGCCCGLYYELWLLESEICLAPMDRNIYGVCPVRYQALPRGRLPGNFPFGSAVVF